MSNEPERVEAKLVNRAFVEDQPRRIDDPVRVAIDSVVDAAKQVQTPTAQETGDLAQLGVLRDLSWKQREALPGTLAKRAMQGGVAAVGAYVLFRFLSSRAVRP